MEGTAVAALFDTVSDTLLEAIPLIAVPALAVFGLVFVIRRGKAIFSGLAK